MSFRRHSRKLEIQVSEAITKEAEQIRRTAEAEKRAQHAHDLRDGILSIHQPHAQPPSGGVGEPALYCTAGCASPWPCETVEFVFRFGRYAERDLTD